MKTRVFLDGGIVGQRRGGIWRYFQELVRGLRRSGQFDLTLYASSPAGLTTSSFVPRRNFRGRGRLGINSWLTTQAFTRSGCQMYYSSINTPLVGRRNVPHVITVHDMIHERYPETFQGAGGVVRHNKAASLRQATRIIAVSGATRADILHFFPDLPAETIRVVHEGVDLSIFKPASGDALTAFRRARGLERPYWLYVGNRHGRYKNFAALLEAYACSASRRDARLVAAGTTRPESTLVKETLARLRLGEDLKIVGELPDAELSLLYAGAEALVYPSRCEGFGLPLLEAMASGTLTIAARAASLPEVGGEVPFYFDPDSSDELAARLDEVAALSSEDRRARLAAGIRRVRGFTWERSREETARVFCEAVEAGAGL